MFIMNGLLAFIFMQKAVRLLVDIKGSLEVISCLMRMLKPEIVIMSMYWLPAQNFHENRIEENARHPHMEP